MLLALLFIIAAVWFIFGYYWYGGYLANVFELDDSKPTPAHSKFDGIDYVPAHPMVLLGHHFASIAGAGPIVGPIKAAALWGWLPAFLWVTLGTVFIGGVHDMGAIVSSMRHGGLSVGEVIKQWVGPRAKQLFLIFTWLALVLVIAVFLELAAATLAANAAVAFAATMYILLALIFGYMVYKWNISLSIATLIMVPLVFLAVIVGVYVPSVANIFQFNVMTWKWILIVYIFLASVLPVWILLQPRDYLSSWLLYFSVFVGGIGMIFGAKFMTGVEGALPAFKGFTPAEGKYLWPLLFITIACGAISGFHSLVGSGTTSKQIDKETHARVIGYGGMLLEGIVATIAIGTIIMTGGKFDNPLLVFGSGIGKFATLFGIPETVGMAIGLLALNSFILTSLDTATRLARYQFQEFFNNKVDRYTASIVGIVFATILVFSKATDPATGNPMPMWKVIWPIFGSANQLVAGLALLGIGVWVIRGLKKSGAFAMYPMIFMMVTTITALGILIRDTWKTAKVLSITAILLIILALWLAYEAYAVLQRDKNI